MLECMCAMNNIISYRYLRMVRTLVQIDDRDQQPAMIMAVNYQINQHPSRPAKFK